ncbi:MAG: dethiobiotin synthase [Sphingobacteriia bacterium]
MMQAIVVAGIGTDVGKTVVSAALVRGLGASYWKPVQAGTEPMTDSQRVAAWAGCAPGRILPEAYCLQAPESPHSSAEKEGIRLDTGRLKLPADLAGPLVIEGAGGLMVPLNEESVYLDVIVQWQQPVVLVASLYLGAINHSLLSVEVLKIRNVPVLGILFTGPASASMESYILQYSGYRPLGRVPQLDEINPDSLQWAYQHHIDHAYLASALGRS